MDHVMGWDAERAVEAYWEMPAYIRARLNSSFAVDEARRHNYPFQTSSQIIPFYVSDVCMIPDCGCAGEVHR